MKGLYAIVGMQHRPGAREKLATLRHGHPLMLMREPHNTYDRNAVQVWADDVHVGFIKGNQVKPLARLIDNPSWRADDQMRASFDEKGQQQAAVWAILSVDGGRWPMAEVEE